MSEQDQILITRDSNPKPNNLTEQQFVVLLVRFVRRKTVIEYNCIVGRETLFVHNIHEPCFEMISG